MYYITYSEWSIFFRKKKSKLNGAKQVKIKKKFFFYVIHDSVLNIDDDMRRDHGFLIIFKYDLKI